MMRFRYLAIPLLAPLLLTSCKNNDDIKILSPTGAPAVCFYDFSNYKGFETNSDAKNVISYLRNDSPYDIVIAPTQGGIQAINRDYAQSQRSDFKIAATITFGNFFLAATGNDQDQTLNKGDKVVLFGQNEVPSTLFQVIYQNLYSQLDIYFVKSVGDATSALKNGTIISEGTTPISVDYVLIAEPALTGALASNPKASIYDNLQSKYQSIYQNAPITQASVFVNTKKNNQNIETTLKKLETDINKAINNPNYIKTGLERFNLDEEMLKMRFGIPAINVVIKSMQTNGLGLGYKKALDIKSSIDQFLKNIAPEIGETDEKIYYK